jgi:UDP-GlcNAc:undecaprenyl-phosphate GlcNAc-1-phosphate transferase
MFEMDPRTGIGALCAFLVTVVLVLALRPLATAVGLVDIPGGRKRHGCPVPVIGGLAMAIGLGFGASLVKLPEFGFPLLLAMYLLVLVGTLDDRFDLPAKVRLIAQACASILVVFGSETIVSDLGSAFFVDSPLGFFAGPFSILFVLVVVNAFNVIDGIDGLAGGLALLALVGLAVVGFGADSFALVAVLLAVVSAYLLFNAPLRINRKVRTFMGDAGSTALGLGIATIGIALCQGESAKMSPVIGLWLIAVPVFDLFSAIVRRLAAGKSPLVSDSEHLHHVLIANGWPARAALVFMLSMAAGFILLGVVGNSLHVPDGVMCLAWIVSGFLFHQLARRPWIVIRLVPAFSDSPEANEMSRGPA